jgi:hypothetical protein
LYVSALAASHFDVEVDELLLPVLALDERLAERLALAAPGDRAVERELRAGSALVQPMRRSDWKFCIR